MGSESGKLHRAVKGKSVGGSKRGKLHRAEKGKTVVGSRHDKLQGWAVRVETAQGSEGENCSGQ